MLGSGKMDKMLCATRLGLFSLDAKTRWKNNKADRWRRRYCIAPFVTTSLCYVALRDGIFSRQ